MDESVLDTRNTQQSHASPSEQSILDSNAHENQVAAQDNLHRTLSQLPEGETIRFFPVAIVDNVSLRAAGSIPGDLLSQHSDSLP